MITNIKEATEELANNLGMSPEAVFDADIIFDIEAEEGFEFEVWKHEDGHIAKEGESIGYVVIDGTSEVFTPYEQYEAEEWSV